LSEFLSNPIWQGLGVILSVFIAIISMLITSNTKKRLLKSHNSKFNKSKENPKEALDGQSVTLYGRVKEELFPGPPNYESINDGDTPQFYWILYTNSPVGIVSRSLEGEELVDLGNSCSFQLSVPPEFYDDKNDIVGKFVKVTGQMFVGHSGHHKTKALVDTKLVEVM
jgi:hypothetical protein